MSKLIPGRATPDHTKAYADAVWRANPKISPDSWRILEGCTIAKVGTGSYRLEDDEQHRKTLQQAWRGGLNLIETGPTYTYGTGLRVIGEELAKLWQGGDIPREAMVLVGKGGYVPEWMIEEIPPQSVALTEFLGHCLHPDFITSQVNLCREALGIETLDGFLIHNPEVQLPLLAHELGSHEAAQAEFYQRLTAAMTVLEQAVQAGELAWYGLSSNGLVAQHDDPLAVNLATVFACAQEAAAAAYGRRKRPALRCIELPLNIIELEALKNINTTAHKFGGKEEVTVLELAARMNLGVLTNRPLNAVAPDGQGWRLAGTTQPEAAKQLDDAIEEITTLENSLNQRLQGWPQLEDNAMLAWSLSARDIADELSGRMDYDQLFEEFVLPESWRMEAAIEQLQTQSAEHALWLGQWLPKYRIALTNLLDALASHATQKDAKRNQPLLTELQNRVPKPWQQAELPALAINSIASIPGVSCVLNGFHNEQHLATITQTLQLGDFPDAAAVVGVK